jgi:hypothetical protein
MSTESDGRPTPIEDVVAARLGLHAVAELLLAGPQFRSSGTIRLRVTADGFATVRSPGAGITTLRVRAGGVLLREPDGLSLPLSHSEHSIAALASTFGVEAGAPEGVYPAVVRASLDSPLKLPAAGVDVVLTALTVGDTALLALLTELGQDGEPVLWPEHFDVGFSHGEVNFGISPGDAEHPLPYAYVGPWTPRQGAFWNESFGASMPLGKPVDVSMIMAFLREGRERAVSDPKAD